MRTALPSTAQEGSMNARLMWAAGLTVGICVCAAVQVQSGEVKVAIEQTPPAVQKTIRSELVGARLEDIAKRRREGETVYETDIIKNGHKWEVVIGEDGQILHKAQEGSSEEKEDSEEKEASAKKA